MFFVRCANTPTRHCCELIAFGALPVVDGVCALRFVVPGMTFRGSRDFGQIPPERGGGRGLIWAWSDLAPPVGD